MQIKIPKKPAVKWAELVDIQGTVKTIDDVSINKMIESLRQNGFCDPFLYWFNPATKEKICIGGNQRLKALKEMQKAGDDIPENLPGLPIKADNEFEAKKILLSLASTFGRINKKDLDKFIEVSELDPVEIDSVTNFIEVDGAENKTIDDDIPDEKKTDGFIEYLKLPYDGDSIVTVKANLELAKQKLDKNTGVNSESDVVEYLLNEFLKKE